MKISPQVIIKKEINNDGKKVFRAYFRGTTNRVHYDDYITVIPEFSCKADLLTILKNKPVERGVIVK